MRKFTIELGKGAGARVYVTTDTSKAWVFGAKMLADKLNSKSHDIPIEDVLFIGIKDKFGEIITS